MPVYVALCVVRPRPGCEVNPEEFSGGMTRGYAAADNFKHALQRFESELDTLKFDLEDMDWCGDVAMADFVDHENPEDTSLANDAKTSGQVMFGNFHMWTAEDEAAERAAAAQEAGNG